MPFPRPFGLFFFQLFSSFSAAREARKIRRPRCTEAAREQAKTARSVCACAKMQRQAQSKVQSRRKVGAFFILILLCFLLARAKAQISMLFFRGKFFPQKFTVCKGHIAMRALLLGNGDGAWVKTDIIFMHAAQRHMRMPVQQNIARTKRRQT